MANLPSWKLKRGTCTVLCLLIHVRHRDFRRAKLVRRILLFVIIRLTSELPAGSHADALPPPPPPPPPRPLRSTRKLCPKPDRDPPQPHRTHADIVRIPIFHQGMSPPPPPLFQHSGKRLFRGGNQKLEIVRRMSCFSSDFPILRTHFRQDFNLCSLPPSLPSFLPSFLSLFILWAPFQCPFAYFVSRLSSGDRPDITFQFLMNRKMERERLSLSLSVARCLRVFPF